MIDKPYFMCDIKAIGWEDSLHRGHLCSSSRGMLKIGSLRVVLLFLMVDSYFFFFDSWSSLVDNFLEFWSEVISIQCWCFSSQLAAYVIGCSRLEWLTNCSSCVRPVARMQRIVWWGYSQVALYGQQWQFWGAAVQFWSMILFGDHVFKFNMLS